MIRRSAAAAVVAAVLLASCGQSADTQAPVFGGGSEPPVDNAALAPAKKAAGIEDCPRADGSPARTDPLPDLTLECLGGGTSVRLSGLTGTPTVINLWASWCGPCREELPLLARADNEYGDRLRILGVDFADSAPGAAIELARSSGVTYPLLVDRASAVKSPLRVVALPHTVFVDAQGTMVGTERTPFRSYADLTAAIRRHLGVAP